MAAERVQCVGYEELVDVVRTYGVEYLGVVLSSMQQWTEYAGELSVYWPTDSYVVAFNVSPQVASAARRLLTDPRLSVEPRIEGATVEIDIPRREWSNEAARTDRAEKLKPYKNDRLLSEVLLRSIEPTPPPEFDEPEGDVRYIWIP